MPHLPDDDTFWTLLLSLRAQGHSLDTGQMAAAMALLARAHAAADGDAARTRFWSRLILVLATSAETAQSLRRYLNVWRSDRTVDLTPLASAVSPGVSSERPAVASRRAVIMVALVSMLAIAYAGMQTAETVKQAEQPQLTVASPNPTPSTGSVERLQPDLRYRFQGFDFFSPHPAQPYLQAGMMALPLLVFAAWVWACRRSRRVRLRAYSGLAAPKAGTSRTLPGLDVIGSPLFTAPAIRQAAHALRAHRLLPSGRLDVPQTVSATARGAGVLRPVRARRRAMPEHLVLIERKAVGDHQAALFRLAARRLQAEGLEVRIYHYSRDPRLLVFQPWQDKPAEVVEIGELSGNAPHQRLIVIGPAIGLLDPGRGGIAPWLADFDCWTDRALLDPVPRTYLIGAERKLIAAGWYLGVAQETGIGQLRHWLACNERDVA